MIFSWQLVVICLSWTMQKKEKQVLFKLETTKSGDSERSLISEMDKTANENIDNSNGNRNSNITMSESEALINRSVSEPNRFLSSITEGSFENYIRPCFTEFLGVALFVFIGTTAICSGRAVEGVALAHGLTIALLITATGSISGGHFNPAVTLGVLIGGAVSPVTAVLYVVSQMIGAIFGSLFTLGVTGSSFYSNTNNGGGHTLPLGSLPSEALLCEIVLTCLLVTTVLVAAADSSTKNSLAPLAIGFAVAVDILAGATVSGASMNPARSFGPAVVVNKSIVWENHWIYWVGPAIGGFVSGIIYRFILAGPEKRLVPPFQNYFRRH